MIDEKDLQEAIAECQGVRNPNANTCLKLASYYTIMDHLEDKNPVSSSYSFASADTGINYKGQTQFAHTIEGMNAEEVWPLMDELMTTLEVVNPKLYNSVMQELKKKERGF